MGGTDSSCNGESEKSRATAREACRGQSELGLRFGLSVEFGVRVESKNVGEVTGVRNGVQNLDPQAFCLRWTRL